MPKVEIPEGQVAQATKFRLYPTPEQEQAFRQWEGSCRWLWNYFHDVNQEKYDKEKKFIFFNEMSAMIKDLKKNPESKWLKNTPFCCLSHMARKYERALKDSFHNAKNRKKFPKKKKRRGGASCYINNLTLKIKEGDRKKTVKIYLPKVGYVEASAGARLPNGKIMSGTLTTQAGKWFLSIQYMGYPQNPLSAPSMESQGVDFGLKSIAALSDGTTYPTPQFIKEAEAKLAIEQRRLSRKTKGSARYRAQRDRVAKLQSTVANRRAAFLHEVSNFVISRAKITCIEDLNVRGMANKKGKKGKSFANAGLGELRRQFRYKSGWNERTLVEIDRYTRSTGVCPSCGHVGAKLPLNVRNWQCTACGEHHDRDVAAAQVIEQKGLALLKESAA